MARARTTVGGTKAGSASTGKGSGSTAKGGGSAAAKLGSAPAKGGSTPTPSAPSPVKKAVAGRGTPGAAAGSRGDGVMESLTKQVRELIASWNDGDATWRVRFGDVLAQAKGKLEHGEWLGWVEAEVPYGERSVQLFMQLAEWTRAHPAMFARVRRLEPGKLTVLVRLREDLLEKLLSRRDHLVPSTGKRVTLEAMKLPEFMEVVGALTGKEAPELKGPIDVLISESQVAARKTVKNIKLMIEHKNELSPELVEDFHDDLVEALDRLAKAFKLDAAD